MWLTRRLGPVLERGPFGLVVVMVGRGDGGGASGTRNHV